MYIVLIIKHAYGKNLEDAKIYKEDKEGYPLIDIPGCPLFGYSFQISCNIRAKTWKIPLAFKR
jgi:hypothetical protein